MPAPKGRHILVAGNWGIVGIFRYIDIGNLENIDMFEHDQYLGYICSLRSLATTIKITITSNSSTETN